MTRQFELAMKARAFIFGAGPQLTSAEELEFLGPDAVRESREMSRVAAEMGRAAAKKVGDLAFQVLTGRTA
jgi:hypothetical protein